MKILKSFLLLLFVAGAFSLNAQEEDAISKYFEKYQDNENFSTVYVSPKMFELFSKLDIDDMEPEVKELIKGIKGLRVLQSDTDGKKYYKEAMSLLNTKEYETLMTVKGDNNENVNFWVKEDGDNISELLLLVGGDEFVLLSFVGNIDMANISKLANSMDINGMGHLKHMKKEKKEKH